MAKLIAGGDEPRGSMRVTKMCNFLADQLEALARKLRPSTRGEPLGRWQDHWQLVCLGLRRIEAAYITAPKIDGTEGAWFDTLAFFILCHHFRDWCGRDGLLPKSVRSLARKRPRGSLALCADIANRAKHRTLTRSTTGDLNSGPSGNDVVVVI